MSIMTFIIIANFILGLAAIYHIFKGRIISVGDNFIYYSKPTGLISVSVKFNKAVMDDHHVSTVITTIHSVLNEKVTTEIFADSWRGVQYLTELQSEISLTSRIAGHKFAKYRKDVIESSVEMTTPYPEKPMKHSMIFHLMHKPRLELANPEELSGAYKAQFTKDYNSNHAVREVVLIQALEHENQYLIAFQRNPRRRDFGIDLYVANLSEDKKIYTIVDSNIKFKIIGNNWLR